MTDYDTMLVITYAAVAGAIVSVETGLVLGAAFFGCAIGCFGWGAQK